MLWRKNLIMFFFCNRYNFIESYNYFLPQVVIAPQLYKIPGLKRIKNKSYLIYLRSESFASNVKFCYEDYLIQKKEIVPNAIFYWGKVDYLHFKKKMKKDNKVVHYISGHPMNDIWYKYKDAKKKGNKIGICSTLKTVTTGVGSNNPFKIIDEMVENKDFENASRYYNKNAGPEFYLAYENSFISIVLNLCKNLKNLSIRPAPYEDMKYYDFIEKKFKVEIDKSSNYLDWLIQNNTIIAFKSSVQITAYVLGINVINLEKIINPKILSGLNKHTLSFVFDKYFYQPKNLKELMSKIKSISFKRNKKIDKFILDTYSINLNKRFVSCDSIISFLKKKNRELIKFKPSKLKYEKLRVYDHLIYLILPKYLLIYYKDLRILIRNIVIHSFYNSQTYAFYNFKKIFEVKKKLKKIYNSL